MAAVREGQEGQDWKHLNVPMVCQIGKRENKKKFLNDNKKRSVLDKQRMSLMQQKKH